MPFIKSFSWTGQLTVGWASEIVPYSGDVDQIPDAKVAIETAYFAAANTTFLDSDIRRRLVAGRSLARSDDLTVIEVWEDTSFSQRLQLLVTDALDVKILKEDPDSFEDVYAETGFSWEVVSFDETEMIL